MRVTCARQAQGHDFGRRSPRFGGLLSVDRGVGRAGVEPATLCLKAPMSGTVAETGEAAGCGAVELPQAKLPSPQGQSEILVSSQRGRPVVPDAPTGISPQAPCIGWEWFAMVSAGCSKASRIARWKFLVTSKCKACWRWGRCQQAHGGRVQENAED
jgi:hypothetical protein